MPECLVMGSLIKGAIKSAIHLHLHSYWWRHWWRPRVKRRCWKKFDVTLSPSIWSNLTSTWVRQLMSLNSSTTTTSRWSSSLSNTFLSCPVISYSRPTAPWFDRECYRMKAKTRRLEKIFRKKHDGASEWDWLEQFQLKHPYKCC